MLLNMSFCMIKSILGHWQANTTASNMVGKSYSITEQQLQQACLLLQVPHRFYFGREIANTDRSIIHRFGLPRRKYLGPTSMDTEMAFLICNQAQVHHCTLQQLAWYAAWCCSICLNSAQVMRCHYSNFGLLLCITWSLHTHRCSHKELLLSVICTRTWHAMRCEQTILCS